MTVSSLKLELTSALSLLVVWSCCCSEICFAFQSPHLAQQHYKTSSRQHVARTTSAGSNKNNNKRQQQDRNYDPFGDFDDDDYYNEDSYSYDDALLVDDDTTSSSSITEEASDSSQSSTIPPSHFFSKKSLTDPSFCSPKQQQLFRDLVEGAGITRPSRIQSLAWPVLLQDKQHAILADQTGSGKTLAYLVPLLLKALQSKNKSKKAGAPKILVLAPTAELADQIRAVCDKLQQKVKFHTMVITATGAYNTNIRDQIRLLQRKPVDVLISTPGRIATILRSKDSGGLHLEDLQALVLDEVDFLLVDETFGPQLRTVGVATDTSSVQFVFCTATLPDNVVETVVREFPSVQQVRGPGLHRVAPTLKEHLVDVSVPSMYNRDAKLCFEVKAKQLLKALRTQSCRRTLVFCNTVESCRMVENMLKRHDRRSNIYSVGAYHNAMTPESRNRNLQQFAASTNKDSVLICTDRAARGVDFDAAPVNHVVLFDFPRDPAEYVRRVGRTARAGRNGVSTVFCYGWQLPIARSIMGSKLESFTIAVNDDEEADDGEEEYMGGVQGRRQRKQKQYSKRLKAEKERIIKGNIEGGRMWQKDKRKK